MEAANPKVLALSARARALRPSATRRFWSLKEQYPSVSLTIVGMDKEEDLAKMLPFPQFRFEDRGKAISSVIPSIEVHAT